MKIAILVAVILKVQMNMTLISRRLAQYNIMLHETETSGGLVAVITQELNFCV